MSCQPAAFSYFLYSCFLSLSAISPPLFSDGEMLLSINAVLLPARAVALQVRLFAETTVRLHFPHGG